MIPFTISHYTDHFTDEPEISLKLEIVESDSESDRGSPFSNPILQNPTTASMCVVVAKFGDEFINQIKFSLDRPIQSIASSIRHVLNKAINESGMLKYRIDKKEAKFVSTVAVQDSVMVHNVDDDELDAFLLDLRSAQRITFAFDSGDPVMLTFDPPSDKVDEFKNLINELKSRT